MPQISPISWILMIMIFITVMLAIKLILPSMSMKEPNLKTMKMSNKQMKW